MPCSSGRVQPSVVICLVAIAAAASNAAWAQPRAAFKVGTVTAQPGTKASGHLQVAARAGDEGTTIPITILHGVRQGPVLALAAGVHGMEYTPILALQRLHTRIDPAQLAGTIIMIHVANMPSFLKRTIYYSPVDGKNLNRVFPGREDGTLSERIAAVITRDVIAQATHVIDLHCGDGNESLRPYSYWITSGPAGVADAGRGLALAFGLDHILIDNGRPTDAANSVYLSNTAITRGKPALTVESGALAQTDDPSIAALEQGVLGVLRHLKMRATGPDPVAKPVWIGQNEVLRAKATGLFVPAVQKGQSVAPGALIGRVTDFFGATLEDIKAPFAGQVLYVIGTPPISAGEPVGFIGAPAASPPQR